MTNQLSKTIVVAFSMGILCLPAASLAATSNADESVSGKRPLLTPMAHTNQDDEAKRMYLPDLDERNPGESGIDWMIDIHPDGLIEIAIINSTPDFNWEQIATVPDAFGIEMRFDPGFDSGFSSDINDLEIRDVFSNDTPPGISTLNIPAPGVLTLLALAGLSSRRRRR